MESLKLYSAFVCPYAHRTRLALHEKGITFDLVEIDLKQMPEWFLNISPEGKVPLLTYGDDIVWESSVINEYLDEVHPESPLFPEQPGQRARSRIWIEYANNEFMEPLLKLMFEADKSRRDEYKDKLTDVLKHINQHALNKSSPFWMGEEKVTVVDFSFYPFFERFPILEHYRDYSVPPEFHNIHRWLDNMRSLKSVQATLNPPQYYIDEFAQWQSH